MAAWSEAPPWSRPISTPSQLRRRPDRANRRTPPVRRGRNKLSLAKNPQRCCCSSTSSTY
ncbi:hypothetical protein [Lysobacter gummosus]|uniref:hypothetical protein n=1 Tax=Lysobacter gummosus TaxID=262324 RepID=UPI003635B9D0